MTRPLTDEEIQQIADGRGSSLGTTCEGDTGYGPCGTWTEYYVTADGQLYCPRGHLIEIEHAASIKERAAAIIESWSQPKH